MAKQASRASRTAQILVACAAAALVTGAAAAGNWPQFRGPSATGMTDEKDLPVAWGGKDGTNVVWKAALPESDDAHSSPVVWGDRVFVTTSKGFEHRVACYRKSDGKRLWETPVAPGPLQKTNTRSGGQAAPTPATDGRRVYALFGTAVLAAVGCDDGKPAWRVHLANDAFDVAVGSSPVIWGESLVLFSGLTDKRSNLTAFGTADGEVKWRTELPRVGYGHSTPALATVGGKRQLIVSVNEKAAAILGVDGDSGAILWSAPGDGETASPGVGSETVYCDSGRGGGGYAADLTKAAAGGPVPLKWKLRLVPMELGSPIVVGDHVYRLGGGGRLICLAVADGKEVYREKLPGASRWASPIATPEGRIYFASAGKSYVVQAGPAFKVLAVNDLGDSAHASAAVSDGRIFLKGRKHLYCIGPAGTAPASASASAPAAKAAPKAPPKAPAGQWTEISQGVLETLERQNIKPAWPGKTTGVAVDRTTGDLFMIVCGRGAWKSTDQGATFKRVDGKAVGGRCETGCSLCPDPAGKRLACFMLDGKSAMTADGGKTWTPIRNVRRGYDWAAVDWSAKPVATIFALVHESGGIGAVSDDAGKSWRQIGKGYRAVGLFGPDVLLCGKEKQKGTWRSTDGGKSWAKVADATPIGVMKVFAAAGYWPTDAGLMTTTDQGKTWRRIGQTTAAWGPYFGAGKDHFVVVDKHGFQETTDGGKTWKLIAPLPPSLKKEYNPRGWFLNVAWDPVGKVCYATRMGKPTWRYKY